MEIVLCSLNDEEVEQGLMRPSSWIFATQRRVVNLVINVNIYINIYADYVYVNYLHLRFSSIRFFFSHPLWNIP